MKKIAAIIKPFKIWEVIAAVEQAGVKGATVTEVQGLGRQGGHTDLYQGAPYVTELVPKLCIEIIIADERVEIVVPLITYAARTGRIGDGKVFLSPIEHVVRIRTGETDGSAVL
jgi:nitrogen regulatory protein PII